MSLLHALAAAAVLAGVLAPPTPGPTPAPTPTPAPQPAPPFDKDVALETLSKVNVQPCKGVNGPRGRSFVIINYRNSGQIDPPKFPESSQYKGTSSGECILGRFRQYGRIAPFSGNADPIEFSFGIKD